MDSSDNRTRKQLIDENIALKKQLNNLIKDDTSVKDEMLAEAEISYRFLFENAIVGIGISDLSGEILVANDTMCKIMACSQEDLSEIRLAETFVSPESKLVIIEGIKTDGKIENFEVQLYNRRNEVYWANLSSRSITYGKENAILTTVIDITENKKKQEELKFEKEFSERIVEASDAVIVGLDKDHLIRLFNNGAEKITGYSRNEVEGKDWFGIFFQPEIINEMNRVWKNAWGVLHHSHTNSIITKTGDERIISWQTTGLYEGNDDNKHILFSIGIDISERVRAEEELSKHREHLEELVEERTIELEEKNKELERYNKLFEGREFRIKELRDKVKELEGKLNG